MKLILVFITFALSLGFDYNKTFFLNENLVYGTIPIDKKEPQYGLFYWLFKCRAASRSSNLVIWLEGGPGCSSEKVLFVEHGPYLLLKNSTNFVLNPWAWNNLADVLFVDQPLSTGLSNCSDTSRIPRSTEQAMEDLYKFLCNFLSIYEQDKTSTLNLYLAGQSYAGHYIPVLYKIIKREQKAGRFKYKIKAILLGSPFINSNSLTYSWPRFAYEKNLINIITYIVAEISRILYMIFNILGMKDAAFYYYNFTLRVILGLTKERFLFTDIRGIQMPVENFTNLIRGILLERINKKGYNWQNCDADTSRVYLGVDHVDDFLPDMINVLESDVKFIVCGGEFDFIVNKYTWNYLFETMNWKDIKKFKNSTETGWWMNGEKKAIYKNYKNFYFFTALDSGHDIFFYHPEFGFSLLAKMLND